MHRAHQSQRLHKPLRHPQVSPWQTHASASHKLWRAKNPKLAAIKFPRVSRRTLAGLREEADPESMELNEAMTEGKSEEAV